MTGWKTGWLCAPPEFVRAVQTVKQFLTFTVAAPWQLAVSYGLRHELDRVPPSAPAWSPSATV